MFESGSQEWREIQPYCIINVYLSATDPLHLNIWHVSLCLVLFSLSPCNGFVIDFSVTVRVGRIHSIYRHCRSVNNREPLKSSLCEVESLYLVPCIRSKNGIVAEFRVMARGHITSYRGRKFHWPTIKTHGNWCWPYDWEQKQLFFPQGDMTQAALMCSSMADISISFQQPHIKICHFSLIRNFARDPIVLWLRGLTWGLGLRLLIQLYMIPIVDPEALLCCGHRN